MTTLSGVKLAHLKESIKTADEKGMPMNLYVLHGDFKLVSLGPDHLSKLCTMSDSRFNYLGRRRLNHSVNPVLSYQRRQKNDICSSPRQVSVQ